MCIASRDVVWMSLDHPQSLWVRRLYAKVTCKRRDGGFSSLCQASRRASATRVDVASKDGTTRKLASYSCPLSALYLPFEVVVEDGLEARPKQHVDPVEKAVKHGDPSSLHDYRVGMGDLDHEKKPGAIAAVGEVAFEVLDAQGQRPRENLVERVSRLPLRGSSSTREKNHDCEPTSYTPRANTVAATHHGHRLLRTRLNPTWSYQSNHSTKKANCDNVP